MQTKPLLVSKEGASPVMGLHKHHFPIPIQPYYEVAKVRFKGETGLVFQEELCPSE